MHEQGVLRGVVALDGPSGTGKSTVARRLAIALGARYLDTGAMYRAVALAALRARVDPEATAEVAALLPGLRLEIGTDPQEPLVLLDGADVAAEIRGAEVTTAVSPVSAMSAVREHLVAEQRRIIAEALAGPGGIVVEGRDIGTVVAPDAPLKVFLTASADTRAERRAAQDAAAGRTSRVDDVRRAVQRRDRLDSGRAASPLRAAEDAEPLDTTGLDVPRVLARLLELVDQRGLRVAAQRKHHGL